MTPAELLAHVEQHLARTSESAPEFGTRALSDPNFVYELRDGREPRQATIRRVLDAIPVGKPKRRAA